MCKVNTTNYLSHNLSIFAILCNTSEEKLESIFSEFGVISCMYYPIDQDTKTHRGFAFIRYTHEGR